MNRKILFSGTLIGILAIILGAFGAHALKKVINVPELATFEIGVRYQIYHSFFLLFLGINSLISDKRKEIIYFLTIIGVFLFSGSLYLLAISRVALIDFRPIGFVTPIGGVLLILAWGILAVSFLSKKNISKI